VVTPLFKNKGSRDNPTNYRGISILPPVAKIFEKILAEQIRLYFEINNLFFHGQHGFRSNHSCESALHEIISKCNLNIDNKLINLLLFIDFQKAFDLVDHDLFLNKLMYYGFSNDAIKLITNYFVNRRQTVKVGKAKSELIDIKLGAPQGSVLGPLIFLIFINDLPLYMHSIYTKLFADDTTLLFAKPTLEECFQECKKSLQLLTDWCVANRLVINWEKTCLMIATNRRINKQDQFNFVDNNVSLV
jgi:hypothetical protein